MTHSSSSNGSVQSSSCNPIPTFYSERLLLEKRLKRSATVRKLVTALARYQEEHEKQMQEYKRWAATLFD